MSYNNYSNSTPNYSPYAYQPTASQDGRGTYQSQGSNNATYSGSSYQPLSAYQSQHQSQSTPQQSQMNSYSGQNYGNITGSGGSGNQAGYAGGRSSVDTTALGNLAYASSLGRNSPSSQTQNYSRPQSTGGYGVSNTYGTNAANASYGTGSAQTGSSGSTVIPREDTSRAPQTAGPSSSFDYSTNTGNTSYQTQRNNPGLSQSSPSAYSFGNQMARPSSGQALQHPGSRGGSQGVASPTVSTAQAKTNTTHYRRESASGHSSGLPGHKSTQKYQAHKETQPRAGTYTPSGQLANTTQGKAKTSTQNQASSQAPSHNSPYSPAMSAAAAAASRQTNNTPVQKTSSQSSTPVSSTFSATVDPSQVFNQVEYQRKQAEAAKKRANNASITNVPQSNPGSGIRAPSISGNGDSAADEATKAQMELEMKQMLEKMREYKSKDPSLFSEIWEGVKKGQPAGRAPSQPATQSPSVASPAVANGQLQSPLTNQLPPESELPAADSSFPAEFDRGRYPAQRRRRGNANFTPDKKSNSKKSKASPAAVDPDTAKPATTNLSTSKSSSSNQKSSTPSAQQSSSPVTVHVSGKGPESAKPTTSTNGSSVPKPNVTYWPEHKKQALADAARATLTKTNVGKNITSLEIHNLLDQNPSYAQMCELLEHRGFAIDRSQFARELLAAVPDLGSAAAARAQPASSASTAAPPSVVSAPPAPPPQAPHRPLPFAPPPGQYNTPYGPPGQSVAPTAPMGNYGGVNPSRPYDTPEQLQHYWYGAGRGGPPAPSMNGSEAQKPSVTWADNGIPQRTFAPVTKQDLARKRSFGDIVDLTQTLSDEEDGEPPAQRKRVEDRTEETKDQETKTSLMKDSHPTKTAAVANGQKYENPAPVVQAVPSPLDNFRYKPNKKEHYLRSLDIIRDMNKRQDAARRSSYNPKSISRDFLLAIGRHPDMDPLNSHLDILRERFRAVDYESDLATFRWDLVDPGGPPLAYETKRALEANDAEQERNSRPARHKPRIAVVVDDNNGDDDATPGASADTTTPKIVRRRGRPSRASLQSPLSQVEQQTPDDSHSDLSRFVYNDLPVMLNNITGENTTTPKTQEPQFNAQASSSSDQPSSQPRERVKGRKGRPPGAKNKNVRPDKGVSKTSWSSLKSQRGSHILGQMPDQETSSPEPTPTRSVPSRPHVNTTPAKPSGLRNAITPTDGIAVVLPSRSPSVSSIHPHLHPTSPHSSKLDRSKSSPAADHSPPTTYQSFKCEWENCPAELHNVETLKKHVRKHRQGQDFETGVACLWRNCYTGDVTVPHLPEVFEGEGGNRYLFDEVEEWERHVIGGHVEGRGGNEDGDGGKDGEDADFGATTNGNEVTEQTTSPQMSAQDWKAPAPRVSDGISVRI